MLASPVDRYGKPNLPQPSGPSTQQTATAAGSQTPAKGGSVSPFSPSPGRSGTSYTGFDPGAHVGETPNITTPKYAVYDYLTKNQIDPNSQWASGAASYLNDLFGTQQFVANGGQRISYGDEFVDSTKKGNDFFWGSNPGTNASPGGGGAPRGGGVRPSPQAAAVATYGPGRAPNMAYVAGQMPQFTLPPTSPLQSAQESALMQILQSGGSMNPQVVAQMKGAQQDASAIMQQDAQGNLAQTFASRGWGEGSGLKDALSGEMQQKGISDLLSSYRDIDINAAQANQGDMLNAIGAADSVIGGQFQRGLAGQNFALQQFLANEELKQREAGMSTSSNYNDRALAQALQLAMMGNELGYANLGFNYANLNSNNNWNAIRMALGI